MAHRAEIEAKAKHLIAEVLHIKEESILENNRFIEDLGADSLDKISLLLTLESHYGSISDEEAKKFVTVADVISYIENYSVLEKQSL